jgi:hypothetical protein
MAIKVAVPASDRRPRALVSAVQRLQAITLPQGVAMHRRRADAAIPLSCLSLFPVAALLACVASLSGCMTDQQFIAQNQAAAINTALSRARFELDCPDATATVLSSKVTQFAYANNRTEYTVGARGCGRQAVYIALCLTSDNCTAVSDTARLAQ